MPQDWHFAQSIAYSLTANRAVLDVASRYRETFLYNIYQMGRNSIQRGSRDSWTITPHRLEDWKNALGKDSATGKVRSTADAMALLKRADNRDPRGYIIPANQRDFPTAVKFANALVKNGITIHRATQSFNVAGKNYPAGSLVVKTAQAFRPHILDMFEPQDHPDDIRYPGAPPTPPYDNAGWTLAYQMGVEFDRVLDDFTGPFEKIQGFAAVPTRSLSITNAGGYFIPRTENDAFVAINRALAAGLNVFVLRDSVRDGASLFSRGTFFIPASQVASALLGSAVTEKGIQVMAGKQPTETTLTPVRPMRIALFDSYGGSIESGWTRFLLEEFEFPYKLVFPPDIDAGRLKDNYDVLILPNDAVMGRTARDRGERGDMESLDRIPEEFRPRVGRTSVQKTLPQIREFLMAGGTVLAM
jgi:hypothetical protein